MAKWHLKLVESKLQELIAEHGNLPAKGWLDVNGWGSMATWMSKNGGIPFYRKKYAPARSTKFVSRGGLALRSWAEVALANFLWARGIRVYRGRKYPDGYAAMSGKKAGWYDIEFDALCGVFDGKRILIEVWGNTDKAGPLGHDLESYLKTKQKKLEFNADNPFFLSLSFEDCYKEEVLTKLLQPSRFKHAEDRVLPSALWSTADQVLEQCRLVCANMPDCKLPPSTWFKHSGTYKNRKVHSWEPESWHNIDEKICRLGGYMKIRSLLGHGDLNMILWNSALVIEHIVEYCEQYKTWPAHAGDDDDDRRRHAKYLDTLITRHVGTREAAFRAAFALLSADNKIPLPEKRVLPKGVSVAPNSGRFQARISQKGSCINLGVFDSIEDAKKAYDAAALKIANGAVVESGSSRYSKSRSKKTNTT